MSNLSLISLITNNQNIDEQVFIRKVKQAKEDKKVLVNAASSYSQKYEKEITEGTKQKQLLLEDGLKSGLSEEDAEKRIGRFLPTKSTPILNFLYFILRETEEADRGLDILRKEYNNRFGHLYHDNLSDNNKTPTFSNYLFESVEHEIFKKLKKLKSLSKSQNLKEATLAFAKCRQLCDKYGLDYDKIPSY